VRTNIINDFFSNIVVFTSLEKLNSRYH